MVPKVIRTELWYLPQMIGGEIKISTQVISETTFYTAFVDIREGSKGKENNIS